MSKHRPVGNEEWSMSSAQNSLAQPEQRSETFRKVTTLGRMTESIAKELNESISGILINANACLHMLAADHPNVEGARETARRTIRDCKRAAEATSRLSTIFAKKS